MGDHGFKSRRFRPGMVLLAGLWILLMGLRPAWAFDSSGLELKLYADQGHANFKYALGQDPVRIHLAIRNTAAQPIVTSRGYSQVELYNHIFVTDPAGVRHVLGPGGEVHKMPPPFFLNDLPWAPAESLPAGWVRTVTFSDLRTLLPMMASVPGWYTIEARQAFIRFAQSGQDAGLGLLGRLDHPGNWHGTVKSKPLQVFIAPAFGARLDVRVVDASAEPPEPLAQIPVKVFTAADLPEGADPAAAWNKTAPVAAGTTGSDGRAVWDEGEPCFPQGDYAAVALVQGAYLRTPIAQGDSAWQTDCRGLIAGLIEAGGAQAGVPIGDFSLFALNSIYLGASATVHGGHVGARAASPGPWLNANAEASFDTKASVKPGVRVYADTLYLGTQSTVYDVYFSELSGKGSVLGERNSPLKTPVAEPPAFKESDPGTQNVTVGTKKTRTLDPGAYKNVTVGTKATLTLPAGTYHLESLSVGTSAAVVCLGETEIRVRGRFLAGTSAVVGPASGVNPGNVVLYVGGANGTAGGVDASPRAVELGTKSAVAASIFAPNGTVAIGTTASLTGAVIGKDIQLGTSAEIRHGSAF